MLYEFSWINKLKSIKDQKIKTDKILWLIKKIKMYIIKYRKQKRKE